MSRPYSQVITKGFVSAVLAIVGATQTAAGTTFDTKQAARNSLSAQIDYNIKTTSITFTAVWEVYDAGAAAWVPVAPSNGAANVAFATGTGTDVAGSIVLDAPRAVYGYPLCRCVVQNAVESGVGSTHDNVTISYSFDKSTNGS